MKTAYYTLTREQLEQFLQLAMCETIREFIRRGELTEAQGEKFQSERTPLLLTRESLLEKFADWLFGKGNESTRVVMCPLPPPNKPDAPNPERAAGVDLKPCERDGARSTTDDSATKQP
jgi:hypothetical protein